MKKKTVYYGSLVGTWVVIVLVIGILYVAFVALAYVANFAYSFGRAIGQPAVWLIAFGCVRLLRPLLWKRIMKEEECFGNTMGWIALIIGLAWLGVRIYNNILLMRVFD